MASLIVSDLGDIALQYGFFQTNFFCCAEYKGEFIVAALSRESNPGMGSSNLGSISLMKKGSGGFTLVGTPLPIGILNTGVTVRNPIFCCQEYNGDLYVISVSSSTGAAMDQISLFKYNGTDFTLVVNQPLNLLALARGELNISAAAGTANFFCCQVFQGKLIIAVPTTSMGITSITLLSFDGASFMMFSQQLESTSIDGYFCCQEFQGNLLVAASSVGLTTSITLFKFDGTTFDYADTDTPHQPLANVSAVGNNFCCREYSGKFIMAAASNNPPLAASVTLLTFDGTTFASAGDLAIEDLPDVVGGDFCCQEYKGILVIATASQNSGPTESSVTLFKYDGTTFAYAIGATSSTSSLQLPNPNLVTIGMCCQEYKEDLIIAAESIGATNIEVTLLKYNGTTFEYAVNNSSPSSTLQLEFNRAARPNHLCCQIYKETLIIAGVTDGGTTSSITLLKFNGSTFEYADSARHNLPLSKVSPSPYFCCNLYNDNIVIAAGSFTSTTAQSITLFTYNGSTFATDNDIALPHPGSNETYFCCNKFDCLNLYIAAASNDTTAEEASVTLINISKNAQLSLTINGPESICPGETATLTAMPSEASGDVAYLWNTGETTKSITVTAAGTYTVMAIDNDDCAASATFTLDNAIAETETIVVTAPNPSLLGAPVGITAHVTPTDICVSSAVDDDALPPVTGTVVFRDGVRKLGLGTLDSSGFATITTTTLSKGVHTIIAEYLGDSNYSGSIDSTQHTVIAPAPPPPAPQIQETECIVIDEVFDWVLTSSTHSVWFDMFNEEFYY